MNHETTGSGPRSQNQLGRLIYLDAATTKGAVDRLEDRGFVAVRADARDRRRRGHRAPEKGPRRRRRGGEGGARDRPPHARAAHCRRAARRHPAIAEADVRLRRACRADIARHGHSSSSSTFCTSANISVASTLLEAARRAGVEMTVDYPCDEILVNGALPSTYCGGTFPHRHARGGPARQWASGSSGKYR
jgi:MarR family protein